MNQNRIIRIIKGIINELELDLSGKRVLTEVGSELYLYSPVIAALAGAEVSAWTADSPFGSANDIELLCRNILDDLKISDKVTIRKNERNYADVGNADIITNSGFVRPLNQELLSYCHPNRNYAIPLMYESWELRSSDIALDLLKKRTNLFLSGVNEDWQEFQIFQYVGFLGLKLIFEAGYEIYENKIIIWSSDKFGLTIKNSLIKAGASEVVLTKDKNELKSLLHQADVLFIADFGMENDFFTNVISISEFHAIANCGVVHLYGRLNANNLLKRGIQIFPFKDGYPYKMSKTFDYLGAQPVFKLFAAGLKVGQSLLEKKNHPLVQCIDINNEVDKKTTLKSI